jgi:hypothetical protein
LILPAKKIAILSPAVWRRPLRGNAEVIAMSQFAGPEVSSGKSWPDDGHPEVIPGQKSASGKLRTSVTLVTDSGWITAHLETTSLRSGSAFPN